MARNLDTAALRALVAIAEMGGVTRAAAQLNLTQSAVSMQVKRLEEVLDQCLLERAGRGVVLTTQGEQLVGYARRLLALNDEIVVRMMPATGGGEVRFGVPCDLMPICVPQVLRDFSARRPDIRVVLHSEVSLTLRERLEAGATDLILTTELSPGLYGETLRKARLVWIGAPGGTAWRRRPLPVSTVAGCLFSHAAVELLTRGAFDWDLVADGSKIAVDGLVAADMSVYMMLEGTVRPGFEAVDHGGALPDLPEFGINMYATRGPRRPLAELLAADLRAAYGALGKIAA